MRLSGFILRAARLAVLHALAALAMAACSAHNRPLLSAMNPVTWADRRIDDEPRIFEGVGPLSVDVESFNGDVMITGDNRLQTVTVQVVRESVHGYGRSDEGKESLADIAWTADLVPGELGQVLQVRTQTSNPEPHFQRAHVVITAPVVDGIKVKTATGRVEAVAIQGQVDITAAESDVRVMTDLPMTRAVTIVIRDGDIDYRVRPESSAKFDAQTIDGRVTHRIKGDLVILPPLNHDRFNAVLNDGKNPVILRTVDGDIRIRVVSDPQSVGEYIFD
jgi:hypothetical protein